MKRFLGLWMLLGLVLGSRPGWADVYGKLVGTVRDEAGNPLPGANVYLEGTHLGAATDADGDYVILNIPPGVYTVHVSFLGYQDQRFPGIEIQADRTTFLNVTLKQAPIEVQPIIVRPPEQAVQKDVTWRAEIVKGQEMSDLPIGSGEEALRLQAGVTEGPGGELHIRGGRSDEITYYVDGLPVTNPLTGKTLSLLDRSYIQELTLLAGTFSAEYGNALAGVINVVTREGTDRWQGELELWGPQAYVYRDPQGVWALKRTSLYQAPDWYGPGTDVHRDTLTGTSLYRLPDVGTPGQARLWLSGSLLGQRLRLFISGTVQNTPSYLPFGYRRNLGLLTKLTYTQPSYVLNAVLETGREASQSYNHAWKYHPEGYPVTRSRFLRAQLSFRHMLTPRLYYRIILGHQTQAETTQVDHKTPDEYEDPIRDDLNEFYIAGDYPLYRRSLWRSENLRMDVVYQRGRQEIKIGGLATFHHLRKYERERLYVYGFIGDPQVESFQRSPYQASVYIQDKLELDNLILNVGLRYDYFNAQAKMWQNIRDPYSPLIRVKPKKQLSPRLGVAMPVSEWLVFFFSYGHFFQIPSFEALYRHPSYLNPDSLPTQLGIVGNPDLDPKQTVSYEAGVSFAPAPGVRVNLSLYGRDIRGLLTTREVRAYPYTYYVYDNQDFASVLGVNLGIKFRTAQHLQGAFSYTYQVARGNRSSPIQGFYNAYTGLVEVMKEFYLDFDRRHLIQGTLIREWPSVGLRLGLTFQASSGLPYTPFIAPGVVTEENSARMPWTQTLDLTLNKSWQFGNTNFDLLLEIRNLLDAKNVRSVYPATGDPFNPGRTSVYMETEDYARNPSHLGPPRTIRLGLRMRWLP